MSDIRSEAVQFSAAEGQTLDAQIEYPADGAIRAWALFAHCFTCGKDFIAARRISRALAARGIAALRFDFSGLGASEGEFAATTFSRDVADLVAGANWLRERGQPPQILVGHSLGGAAVLAAAGDIPEVGAVVTIGAPSDPAHVRHLFDGATDEIRASGRAEVDIGGRELTIGRDFLDDIERWDLPARVRRLDSALMVMHSPRDRIVSIEHARLIFEAARHPKSFVSLDTADHLLTQARDADYVADVLSAWVARYVEVAAPAAAAEPELAAGEVQVRENGEGRFSNTVQAGRHRLRADEPSDKGGADSGPGPHEYLLAGLGACTSMTLRMYAEHKGLSLEHVAVTLSHSQVDATACADCEHTEGRVHRIDRRIHITGDLTAEQRRRMVEIADRCPVHRTLTGQLEIHTRETDD